VERTPVTAQAYLEDQHEFKVKNAKETLDRYTEFNNAPPRLQPLEMHCLHSDDRLRQIGKKGKYDVELNSIISTIIFSASLWENHEPIKQNQTQLQHQQGE